MVARPRQQAAADGISLAIVDVGPGEQVLAIAAAVLDLGRDPRHQFVARERTAKRAFEDLVVVIAVSEAGVAIELGSGPLGHQVDRARGRPATICRPLRPAQDFDLFKVVKARQLRRWPRDHRPVLEKGDRAVGTKVDAGHADAADKGAVDAELVADRQVGDRPDEVGDRLNPAGTDLVRRDRRDRRRGRLKRSAALGRGDDDFLLIGGGVRVPELDWRIAAGGILGHPERRGRLLAGDRGGAGFGRCVGRGAGGGGGILRKGWGRDAQRDDRGRGRQPGAGLGHFILPCFSELYVYFFYSLVFEAKQRPHAEAR